MIIKLLHSKANSGNQICRRCPYFSAPASLHPSSGLHPHLQSKWMTPAGVGRLMLGPVRWHWQLNYPTGHGGWLSAAKSSGHPSLASNPQSPHILFPTPLSPLVKRATLSPSSLSRSSWQVISTITITTITGVINKWPTPSQAITKAL